MTCVSFRQSSAARRACRCAINLAMNIYSFCKLPAPPGRGALGAFGLHLILEEALAGLELNGVDAALERFGDRRILLEARRVGLPAQLPEEHGVALLLAGGAFPRAVFAA